MSSEYIGKSYINNKCNNDKQQTLDVNISDLVLTPLTCASLISEILKCLVYQKSQIPYPYNWLKNVVSRKRKCSEEDGNYFIDKQFRVASAAFDTVEEINNNIKKFLKLGNNIKEVIILLGPSPLCPKEVYKFNLPSLASGHIEFNHHNMTNKFQHNILRSIFLSPEWISKMDQPLAITNLHIFLKLSDEKSIVMDNRTLELFSPSASFSIPKNAHILTINIFYDDSITHNCCSNLTVYEDNVSKSTEMKKKCDKEYIKQETTPEEIKFLELDVEWLQMNAVLKGFKENFVKNVPVSELW